MPRLAPFAATVPVLLLATHAAAAACTCSDHGPPCQAYWASGVVFRGRAEAVRPVNNPRGEPHRFNIVRFAVLEGFKGVSGATVEVRAPAGRASCALRFTIGREYFVHAAVVDGAIATDACHRTRRIERARADLAYARSIARGGEPLGRIAGRVLLLAPSPWTGHRAPRAMPDVPVTLRRGAEFAVMVRSNASGAFEAAGLLPGRYTITADVQGRFERETRGAAVELRDPRGCAVADLLLRPDGQVAGRVLDARGEPIAGLTLDLTIDEPPGSSSARLPDRLQTVTGSDGRYVFTGVPPGRFVIGIDARPGGPDGARVFYPGAAAEDAEAVTVEPGAFVALDDFVVPAPIRLTAITGVVLDPNRVPAAGARLYLRGAGAGDAILTAPVLSGADGRFTIAVVEGGEYVLFAERPRPGNPRWLDITESVRIFATRPAGRHTLLLRPLH